MKNGYVFIAVSTLLLVTGTGCFSDRGVNKEKFAELGRTARELQTAVTAGDPCDLPDPLLQQLSSGTDALRDTTVSPEEKGLVAAFANLVTTYEDGRLLCKHRTELTHFPFVPKGRIYVVQELDPIVQKYDLSTEKHVYRPTGVHWKSLSGDSIKVIWGRAEQQIRAIENFVNTH